MIPSTIKENISLKPYNSWRVGGEAEFFSLPSSIEEVKSLLIWADKNKHQVTLLGGGSNVLISDRGIKGLVICFKKFVGIENQSTEKTFILKCGPGVLKQKVMRLFLKEELAPSLFLSGLPGDLSGGIVMNAGVSEDLTPKEFHSIVDSFKVLKKEGDTYSLNSFKGKNIKWSYRKSEGWQPGVIVEVTLSFPKTEKILDIKNMVKNAQELRALKQPLHLPSCGSVFRNPHNSPQNKDKKSAGYFIEQAGLKGYQYGGVEISRRHANFIVNNGDATALDVHCAISIAKEKVAHMFNITLETEVKYLGDWKGII